MSDSCRCFDVRARVVMDEPKLSGKLDFSGEIILCSDGEDYKRGYEEGHAKGLADGQKVGYENGYNEGQVDGYKSGYEAGKTEGLTEGYDNGYEKGKTDGYKDGYEEGYSKGYEQGLIDGAKEEQEKRVDITKNGSYVVLPDDNKVLSKVTVDVDVKAEGFDEISYFEQKFNEVTKNGTLTNFDNTFNGKYVDDITFKPTHDIIPIVTGNMFMNSRITNLSQLLEDRGVRLDTSQCTSFGQFIATSAITHLPCISLEGLAENANTGFLFMHATELLYIKKLITRADIVWYDNAFLNCNKLKTIDEIEGEIGTNFKMPYCYSLNIETAKLIMIALKDYSGTEKEFVYKIIFAPQTWVFLDAEGNNSPHGNTWREYVNDKGWDAS